MRADLNQKHRDQLTFGAAMPRCQDSSTYRLLGIADRQQTEQCHQRGCYDGKQHALDNGIKLLVRRVASIAASKSIARLKIDDHGCIRIEQDKETEDNDDGLSRYSAVAERAYPSIG